MVVGDDTADEVGVSLVQGGQPVEKKKVRKFSPRFSNSQGVELGSERRRDGLEGLWSGVFSLLLLLSFVRVLLWLARMVPENDGIEILLRCSL